MIHTFFFQRLFYLNTAEQDGGGATVFNDLQFGVSPIKGGALFWFNTFRNGSIDYRTSHAACPVLKGNKFIATIWFRMFGQMHTYPC